ncbi:MAG: transposase [Gemmataceae bacterium]
MSKCHPDANLFAPPPPYRGNGRPPVKGPRLPKPRQAVAGLCPTSRSRLTVPWYGGGTRRVAVVTGSGHWYKGGHGLVPIRWVFVEDRTGTHRDEYLLTTDTGFSPSQVIAAYCGRWNIETTFQESRSQLGLETTRGWCRRTVLRAAPCLLGLYSVVAILFASLPESKRAGSVAWPGKVGVAFSDAVRSVRRWLWAEGVFPQAGADADLAKLPPEVRELLLSGLAPAA